MSRLIPKSLFGQTLLILLTGLAASHLIGAWIYTADREQAVRAIGGLTLAQRVANITQLVVLAPAEWRERIVASSNDPSFRVSLSPQQPAIASGGQDAPAMRAIGEFLAERLPEGAVRQIRVAVSDSPGPPFAMGHGHAMRMGPMMHAVGAWRGLQVAVQIAGGQWLSFASVLPESGPAVSRQFILSMAVMAVIILVVSIWAVRRVTAPLGKIAQAAERLGKDIATAPLAEIGTIEMRRAVQAFNDMQARLRRFVNDRTRLLAAISHDLRTPLTLLRLRAEDVENADERERMLATIDDMIVMIEATLAFARDEASAEPRRRIDLTALVASVADDMAAAGRAVTMEASPSVICECEPGALKRTVSNLIDNAVKYGKAAHVAIETIPGTATITVEDEGPGIPEEELGQVFQPFYRVEESRSRETGGIGLGLAIAQSIAQAHGGEITLSNRQERGLRATIALPV
jgi:signal transduction histidine kinase